VPMCSRCAGGESLYRPRATSSLWTPTLI